MEEIKQALKQYGLNEPEVTLYLAALELGEAGMSELSRKAGLKRTSAYVISQSLEKKGLLGSFKMKSGLKYVPTQPDFLITKTQKNLESLKTLVPQLKSLVYKPDQRPKITYYEGTEGYFIAAEDSLNRTNAIIRHIGSISEIHNVVSEDWDLNHYIPTRIKNHIKFQALYFESQMPKSFLEANHAEVLREVRYLPEKFIYKTSKLIYGNKVAIYSSKKELVTVIIESPDIAESERKTFDTLWELLKNPQAGNL